MPSAIVSATKRNAREALSYRCGDWWPLTTSSAGNAGGTTAVFASLIGRPVSSLSSKYLHIRAGTNAGEWREITDFAPATGTVTVSRAYTGQVATSVACEVHTIRPDLYTLALNEALYKAYPSVYREIESHVIPHTTSDWYGMPRNMRNINRILRMGSETIKDLFDRADSTTDPGTNWIETTGNWGVISERLYAQTDADTDLVTRDTDLKDGVIQAIVRGTLNSGTTYRSPALVFRIAEDRTGAIDTANYLLVRLLNAVVDLRKVDASTESSLTTATQTTSDGTDYQLRVQFIGSRIRVWVDDVEVISYELLGLNLKYRDYPRCGVRWDKGGSPATAARVDDYRAYQATNTFPFADWEIAADSLAFRLPAQGTGWPSSGELLLVQGRGALSELAADTTFEALASDTTAALEIATTDPAWSMLLDTARYILYEHAAQPGNEADEEKRAAYLQFAASARASLNDGQHLAMPQPSVRLKYPL